MIIALNFIRIQVSELSQVDLELTLSSVMVKVAKSLDKLKNYLKNGNFLKG